MKKTIIKHHTKAFQLESIFEDNLIKIEGCNVERQVNDIAFKKAEPMHWFQAKSVWNITKFQYKHIGRYVWLTEEEHAHCCNFRPQLPTVPFSFYAEDIGALRWSGVRTAMIYKKGPAAKRMIELLEAAAIALGDNPERWWVSKRAISLDHWLYDNDPWFDPAWIVAANDDDADQLAA